MEHVDITLAACSFNKLYVNIQKYTQTMPLVTGSYIIHVLLHDAFIFGATQVFISTVLCCIICSMLNCFFINGTYLTQNTVYINGTYLTEHSLHQWHIPHTEHSLHQWHIPHRTQSTLMAHTSHTTQSTSMAHTSHRIAYINGTYLTEHSLHQWHIPHRTQSTSMAHT